MIHSLSHVTLFVRDQQEALTFYTKQLDFDLRDDQAMGNGMRWVTVSPKQQPELLLILMPVQPGGIYNDTTLAHLQALMERGAIVPGVFTTSDCRATFEELSARGVEFVTSPQERPYGVEATFRDPSGNIFSLTERKNTNR